MIDIDIAVESAAWSVRNAEKIMQQHDNRKTKRLSDADRAEIQYVAGRLKVAKQDMERLLEND